MKQTLHIFRKDVRHLAPFILVVLALQVGIAISAVHVVRVIADTQRFEAMLTLCEVCLPFSWLFLIARNTLQETPVGENAFWLTRPYSWPSLFAAKFLFALAFLNLPLLVSDLFVLQTLGFPFHLNELLLRQLPLLAFVIVPGMALSSISRGLSQFSLFVVSFFLVLIVDGTVNILFSTTSDLAIVLLIPVLFLLVIAIQFAKRFMATRVILAALVAIVLPAVFSASDFGQKGSFSVGRNWDLSTGDRWSRIHMQVDTDSRKTFTDSRRMLVGFRVPLQVKNLPSGVTLRGEGVTQIESSSKEVETLLVRSSEGSYFLDLTLANTNSLEGKRVSFRTSLDVTALNDRPSYRTKAGEPSVLRISAVGLCKLYGQEIDCWSGPVRPAGVEIRPSLPFLTGESVSSWESDAERALVWGFIPLDKRHMPLPIQNGSELSFTPRTPLARFHATFSAQDFPIYAYSVSTPK